MGSYLKSIKDSFKARKSVGIGCVTSIIIVFLLIITISIGEYMYEGDIEALFVLIILTTIFIITGIGIISSPVKIKKTEEEILKITIAFLKESKIESSEIQQTIKKIFNIYREIDIDKLVQLYVASYINVQDACDKLAIKKTDVKYYVLSTLLDLAADDTILTIDEESFIEKVRRRLLVHEKTFNYIKNRYINQGLKEERKIIEEQNRKKTAESFSKSFLPYNAYKILGITPSVTKAQLKKVYRTLAKKYHPDKFYGQSDEIIQQAEDKFQEITEAYELVKRYKAFK